MATQIDVRTSLGLSRGAVTATEVWDLIDEKGVRLPAEKGDHQVLVLQAAPCCSHSTTRAVEPHRTTQFETSEHILIAYGLNLRLDAGLRPAQSTMLALTPNFHLTYGQIIALGGDFYGNPDAPVCLQPSEDARRALFAQNFKTLVNSGQEASQILRAAKKFEFDPIAAAIRRNQVPSGVYVYNSSQGHGVLSDADRAFDEATGGTTLKNGRYLNLAFNNFDHFGTDAIACYTAGHTVAQQMAFEAHSLPAGQPRDFQLQNAYALNAFADHFLTDQFSAGHMRTPRRALFNLADFYETQVGAGLLAQRMHDEDNKFGLWVENAAGDRWVAYGDKRYRDRWNTANRRIIKRAVQQSIDEVWDAYTTGQIRGADSQVLRYVPKLVWEIGSEPTASAHRNDTRNWAPLFWRNPVDGNVWRREALFNPGDRRFGEYAVLGWGISTTLLQIKMAGAPPWMPDAEYTRAGLPLHPNEAGPSGEFGWPAEPSSVAGQSRVMYGATGPQLSDLRMEDWVIDGAPEPPNSGT